MIPITKRPAIDIDILTVGPALDAAVAKWIFGLDRFPDPPTYWQEPWMETKEGFPPFSTDLNASRIVEAEIERRGLEWSYEVCLLHQAWKPDGLHVKRPKGNFLLITATPEQRCRAAYRAVIG